MNVDHFLKKIIIYPAKIGVQVFFTLISFGLIFSFLVVYTPFEIDKINEQKYVLSLILAAISSSAILIVFAIAPLFFSKLTTPEGYTNLKMIIQFIVIMIVILISNNIYVGNSPFYQRIKIDIRYIFLLMDIVFFPGILLANLVNWKRKELIIIDIPLADKTIAIEDLKNTKAEIILYANDQNIAFKFHVDEFVYASSNENYSDIYLLRGENISRNLIRITFNNLYDILHEHPQIIRCHRTRIINLMHVNGLVKDGKNTLLRLVKINEAIPVSRKYPIKEHFSDSFFPQ